MAAKRREAPLVDIFDEVDEELRAERAGKLLKRYGGLIVGLALLTVAAVGAWQGWRWYQAKQDAAFALEYLTAMRLADSVAAGDAANAPAATAALDRLSATAPVGYRTLARLRDAALKADSGDLDGATVLWNAVADDGAADPLLRDLANLSWAGHSLDHGDPALVEGRLLPLATASNPWHLLAAEQLALLDLRRGKVDQAKEALRSLAQDPSAPDGVRGRASGLLARLGG